MTNIQISLPESMKVFVEEQVAKGGYSSASEHLQEHNLSTPTAQKSRTKTRSVDGEASDIRSKDFIRYASEGIVAVDATTL